MPHLLLAVAGCWWAQVKNLDTGEVLAISESFDEGVLTAGVVGDAAAAAKAGYVRQQSLLEETLMKNIASALGPAPVTHVRAGSGRLVCLGESPCCGRFLFFCSLPRAVWRARERKPSPTPTPASHTQFRYAYLCYGALQAVGW